MDSLTDRQRQVLERIRIWLQERGRPPTIRELGEDLGIGSTNGVNDHLKALEHKGALTRDDTGKVRLTEDGLAELGRVQCAECGGAGHVLAEWTVA